MTDAAPKPWEKQPGESDQAWEAFCIYRDMDADKGKRAINDVAEQLGKSRSLVARWCNEKGWVERCRAFDTMTDRQRLESLAHERMKAATRHAQIGQLAQSRGATYIRDHSPDTMGEATRLVDVGVRTEREALGMAQQIDVTSGGEQIGLASNAAILAAMTALDEQDRKDAESGRAATTDTAE